MDDINVDIEVLEQADNSIVESPVKKPEHSEASPSQKHRPCRLPLARIKHIMKKDPDCSIIAQDAVFLLTKATEMFINYLGQESYKQIGAGKRKTVMRRDVDNVIETHPHLCFLDGALE